MTGTVLISQNAAQNGLKKVHVTLSISELARDYAKINRINLSSVLENALKSGSFDIKKSSSPQKRLPDGKRCGCLRLPLPALTTYRLQIAGKEISASATVRDIQQPRFPIWSLVC